MFKERIDMEMFKFIGGLLIWVTLVVGLPFLCAACKNKGKEQCSDYAEKVLVGKHELQAINNRYSQNESGSIGGFFIFGFGGMSGGVESKEVLTVTFAWTNNKNEIVFSRLSVEDIRLSFNESVTPTVKFKWRPCRWERNESAIMKEHIIYAVIECQRGLWNPEFNLPLQKKE